MVSRESSRADHPEADLNGDDVFLGIFVTFSSNMILYCGQYLELN